MEDYLEAIAFLREDERKVRVRDISRTLGVKMPSVTSALKKLSDEGLVVHERYGRVELTSRGDRIAEDVIHRHEALTRFLTEILGVDPDTAARDACAMEHPISTATRDRLSMFVEFVLSGTKHPEWLGDLRSHLESGGHRGHDAR
jgi:DtxR family Mn-dependent transcriptional regulator